MTDKIGFEAPEDDFFRNDRVVVFAKDIIYSEAFRNRPYWKWPVVEQIFQEHVSGKTDAGQTIWKWINIELWLRAFMEEDTVIQATHNHDERYAASE